MKYYKSIPEEIKDLLENDKKIKNELEQMNNKNITKWAIPMHVSKMRLLSYDVDEEYVYKLVILPAYTISILDIYKERPYYDKYDFKYTLDYTGKAFPLAHIFSNSGSICLGDIFVPDEIPKYSPQLPFETLLLYNDRHVSHGNPYVTISDKTIHLILNMLINNNVQLPQSILNDIVPDENLIQNDIIWRISAYILENVDKKEYAFELMDTIYKIIFKKEN